MSVRLNALVMWSVNVQDTLAFYAQWEGVQIHDARVFFPDGHEWRVCPGRVPCKARGPYGIVPALAVGDIVQAKAWVRRVGRPIVFEEVVPGLARLTFLAPDGQPVDLVQELDTRGWQRGARIPEVQHVSGPPRVEGLFELSLYANETSRVLRVYREVLGLEVGLAYFAHTHLLLEPTVLVVRPTWRACREALPHTPALLLQAPVSLPERCRAEGLEYPHPLPCAIADVWCWDGEHTAWGIL